MGKGQNQELWRGYQHTKLPHGLGYITCIQKWHIEDLALRPQAQGESRKPYPVWGELLSSISPLEDDAKKRTEEA